MRIAWTTFVTLATLAHFFLTTRISAKTVDLSRQKLRKEDFFVEIQSQLNIREVTDLILHDNEFDSFLDCSTNLESLRTLDLSHNRLQRFFFLCKDEYNLEVLNVSHNRLEYIDDKALNNRIPKLKILDLSSNKLSVINETMLEHFKILEYLSLANNPIYDGIHENAFANLQALKHLDLRNVSATHFSAEFFATLTNLSTLDLSWNAINAIPLLPTSLEELDLSGTKISELTAMDLPQLRELRMNRMPNLTSLALNDLQNLTSLETLSVVGCRKLTEFTISPYTGLLLPRLQRLLVQECALQTLEPDLRPIVQRASIVDVRNNPWKCDCRMQWVNSINSTKELSRDIRCRTPDRHHDKLLGEIPDYELQCDNISLFYPILWSCISLLVAAIVLLAAFLLMRRQVGHWGLRGRNRDTVTYTNVVESSNDLVRILAETTRNLYGCLAPISPNTPISHEFLIE